MSWSVTLILEDTSLFITLSTVMERRMSRLKSSRVIFFSCSLLSNSPRVRGLDLR